MYELIERIQTYHESFSPSKVARKYQFLAKNAFSFYRGSNFLFYQDLSTSAFPASPITWICGDLHLENFGSYKGDNRLVYFDMNDFDESTLAPVAWELARMITSILVAFDAINITDKQATIAAEIFLKEYAATLSAGKPKYIESRIASGIVKKFLLKVERRSARQVLQKRTHIRDDKLCLHHHNNKQLKIDKELKHNLTQAFKKWMDSNNQPPNEYKVLDARFRFAGTGSIGIHRYIFLIEKLSDARKHMLIDMKEATPSSLRPFTNIQLPVWESEAHRIIYLQKMMQNVPPAQLSALQFQDSDYVLQELQPAKDRIDFKMIQDDFNVICWIMKDMAVIAASAHLRGVGRKGSCTADELIEFANEMNWQKELLNYAVEYKRKVFNDYDQFCSYIKNRK